MAVYSGQFWSKRKSRSSASSDESTLLPEIKKSKPKHHEDEIMTALSMTQDVGATNNTLFHIPITWFVRNVLNN